MLRGDCIICQYAIQAEFTIASLLAEAGHPWRCPHNNPCPAPEFHSYLIEGLEKFPAVRQKLWDMNRTGGEKGESSER